MLRRLATLSVLLLSLSGVIPPALACVSVVQGACCPARPSHSTLAANEAPCCVVDVGSPHAVAAIPEAEPRVINVPAADEPAALPINAIAAVEPASVRENPSNKATDPDLERQWVYLLTGRLRL